MNGGTELLKLAHLLRVGAGAARDIAKLRPTDAGRIERLAVQAEQIAAELRAIAAIPREPVRPRPKASLPPHA